MPPAFAAPIPLPPTRAFTALALSPLRLPRVHRVRPSCMSLTHDLLFKTLEVAAASLLTGSVAAKHASAPTASEPAALTTLLRNFITHSERVAAAVDSGTPSARRWQKLAICLAIDLAGAGSLSFPFVGDLLDLAYAPLCALMVHALFANPLFSAVAFAEEILPGTDAFPTATIAWAVENYEFLSSLRSPPSPPPSQS